MAGGQKFTILNLSQAHLQLSLDEESLTYNIINSHKGLYHFNHSIASISAVFQKTMDEILQGIPKAMSYIDDILITGSNDAKHLQTLKKMLAQMELAWHLSQV